MGNTESLLRDEEIQELHKSTAFRQINELLKRYREFIPQTSEGEFRGLTLDECMMVPEFSGCPYLRKVAIRYLEETGTYLQPYRFIQFCALLSPHTSVQKKRSFLYDYLNIQKEGALTHEEVFRLLKHLYGTSLSDDRLLDVTSQILNDPRLSSPGKFHKNELDKKTKK